MVRRLVSQPELIVVGKKPDGGSSPCRLSRIGIDLGKTTFHLVALGTRCQVVVRKKFSCQQLLLYTANLPSSLIGMEACVGSHFLGRALREQTHWQETLANRVRREMEWLRRGPKARTTKAKARITNALASARSTGINVKLGRGGIREIEFVTQVFQLVRGGKDPSLRLRP